MTITSARGDVAVTLSESTVVYEVGEAGRNSLAAGVRVRVAGAPGPDGVVAQSVVIIPEGAENLFYTGGGGGPGGRPRGQAP